MVIFLDELLTIFCNNMDDIIINPDEKPLTPEDVRKGRRPVKRARTA